MANVRNARWVGAQLSDLFLAARGDDQSVASPHLAPEEESSALVGCVPQPPAQASISIREVIRRKEPLTFGHCPKREGGGGNPNPKVLGYFLDLLLDIGEEKVGVKLFQKFCGSFWVILR